MSKEVWYNVERDDWSNCSTSLDDTVEHYLDGLSMEELSSVEEVTLYKGVKEYQNFEDFLCVDWLIESMHEYAGEVCGEVAEDYLWNVTRGQKDELLELITDWGERNNLSPSFFLAKEVQEFQHKVDKDLLKEYMSAFK